MDAAVDRRTASPHRIPLFSHVQLQHAGLQEPLPAAALNVGQGGLAMRASYLPDVGTRFRCRFELPRHRAAVTASGEVVWARGQGAGQGEFGLRFTELPGQAADALEKAVERETPPTAAPSRMPSTVDLRLQGSPEPIAVELASQDGELLRVTQALPLFRIGTSVTAELPTARNGVVHNVAIRLEGAMPWLDIAVRCEPCGKPIETSQRPAGGVPPKIVEETAEKIVEAVVEEPDADLPDDATIPDVGLPFQAYAGELASPGIHAPSGDAFRRQQPRPVNPEPRTLDDAALAEVPSEKRRAPQTRDDEVGTRSSLANTAAGMHLLLRLLGTWAATCRKTAQFLMLWARQKAMPRFKAIAHSKKTEALELVADTKEWLAQVRPAAGKSRDGSKSHAHANHTVPKKRHGRRKKKIAGALFLTGGVALLAYGLSPSPTDAEPRAAAARRSTYQPALQPSFPSASNESTTLAEQHAPDPLDLLVAEQRDAEELADVQPVDMRAEPVADSAEPVMPPSFGHAELTGGKRFTIRMSRPVQSLQGVEEETGVSVIIPGALALDRAGPIAASHPGISRAMILNRGDHSALTLRFSEGQRPAYRITGNNNLLEVVVAQ